MRTFDDVPSDDDDDDDDDDAGERDARTRDRSILGLNLSISQSLVSLVSLVGARNAPRGRVRLDIHLLDIHL